MNFTIVTCIWKRDPALLSRSLSTWVNQSHPPYEIIVSDTNPDEIAEIKEICDRYAIVTRVHTPMDAFSVSRSINIGIRRTSEESTYVACTGSEMLFSEHYLRELSNRMTPDSFTQMACGWFLRDIVVPLDPHQDWDRLVASIVPGSNTRISGGTFLCATRDWWLKIRGYDEGILFLWPDSDLVRRAILSGLKPKGIPWGAAQAIHQWHEPFGIVAPGRSIDELQADPTITRNLNGWGQ